MVRARRSLVVLLGGLVLGAAVPAWAQDAAVPPEPPDQIVLSGDVVVRRGLEAGEVVVLRGTASVGGVVRGDVIVVDGRIEVTGQVSGSVVSVNGSIVLGPSARVLGDVLAGEHVRVATGARVDGDVREGVSFAFRTPVHALGQFAPWLAVWFSVLALGMFLLLLAPRAADAVALAAREAPWPSAGWGVVAFAALPLVGIVGVLTLVWLPLGLGILFSLFLVFSIGLAWSAFVLGRQLWREPRGRFLAFLIGWAILTALAAIPFVGGVVWLIGSVFGVGASTVGIWRARGARPRLRAAGGRHRPGGKMPAETPAPAGGLERMIIERDEGAGL